MYNVQLCLASSYRHVWASTHDHSNMVKKVVVSMHGYSIQILDESEQLTNHTIKIKLTPTTWQWNEIHIKKITQPQS